MVKQEQFFAQKHKATVLVNRIVFLHFMALQKLLKFSGMAREYNCSFVSFDQFYVNVNKKKESRHKHINIQAHILSGFICILKLSLLFSVFTYV